MEASAPEDLDLSRLVDRFGVLECMGAVIGYLKFELGTFHSLTSPREGQPQVWFTIFNADGVEGRIYDDYPPFTVVADALKEGRFNLSSSGGPDQDCELRLADGDVADGIREKIATSAQKWKPGEFDYRFRQFADRHGVLEVDGETVGYLQTGLSRHLVQSIPPQRGWNVKYELFDANMTSVRRFGEHFPYWIAQFLERGQFNFSWAKRPEVWCHFRWTDQ